MDVRSVGRHAAFGVTLITLALVTMPNPPPAHAQTAAPAGPAAPEQAQSADDLVAQADAFANAGNYNAASSRYVAAAKVYKTAGKTNEEAGAYKKSAEMVGKLADVSAGAGRYKEAADLYTWTANVYKAVGKPVEAAAAYKKSAEMFEKLANALAGGAPAAPSPVKAGPAPEPPGKAVPAPETTAIGVKPLPSLHTRDANGRPLSLLKLSRFTASGFPVHYTSVAVGAGGGIHAVFTEMPTIGKSAYLYYRASSDGGKSWSEPKNLSDDESGNSVSFARVVVDGQGRVYAIWKYVGVQDLLDGPGGYDNGTLCCRVLQNGAWSKRIPLGIAEHVLSWFAAVDPHGSLHVIWSQTAPDVIATRMRFNFGPLDAEMLQQVAMDGANPGTPKVLMQSKPLSKAEFTPTHIGIINLSGYVDAAGVAHFVGERKMSRNKDLNGAHETGGIVHWDGQKLDALYAYKSEIFSGFGNPPALMLDDKGREHLLLIPEVAETPSVRDYLLTTDGGKVTLGDDPVAAISTKATGAVGAFQVAQAPGGRMMVMSIQRDIIMDGLDLYLTIYDKGKWTTPLSITDNAYRRTFFSKQTGGGNSVSRSASYTPAFAAAAMDRSGHPVLLLNNMEYSIVGLNNAGTLGSRPVIFSSINSISYPMIFFVRL